MTESSTEQGEMRAYSEKLRAYSMDELEDVYFNIDILKHPVQYKLVVMEMERRSLHSVEHIPVRRNLDLGNWLLKRPFFAHHPGVAASTVSTLLFLITSTVTFVLLTPIWFFAIPLHFMGLQTAIVYFACAPVAPIMAAGIGGRLGGRGLYGIWALGGVSSGMLLFNMTGVPSAIILTIIVPSGPGGRSMSRFFRC